MLPALTRNPSPPHPTPPAQGDGDRGPTSQVSAGPAQCTGDLALVGTDSCPQARESQNNPTPKPLNENFLKFVPSLRCL